MKKYIFTFFILCLFACQNQKPAEEVPVFIGDKIDSLFSPKYRIKKRAKDVEIKKEIFESDSMTYFHPKSYIIEKSDTDFFYISTHKLKEGMSFSFDSLRNENKTFDDRGGHFSSLLYFYHKGYLYHVYLPKETSFLVWNYVKNHMKDLWYNLTKEKFFYLECEIGQPCALVETQARIYPKYTTR